MTTNFSRISAGLHTVVPIHKCKATTYHMVWCRNCLAPNPASAVTCHCCNIRLSTDTVLEEPPDHQPTDSPEKTMLHLCLNCGQSVAQTPETGKCPFCNFLFS